MTLNLDRNFLVFFLWFSFFLFSVAGLIIVLITKNSRHNTNLFHYLLQKIQKQIAWLDQKLPKHMHLKMTGLWSECSNGTWIKLSKSSMRISVQKDCYNTMTCIREMLYQERTDRSNSGTSLDPDLNSSTKVLCFLAWFHRRLLVLYFGKVIFPLILCSTVTLYNFHYCLTRCEKTGYLRCSCYG